MNNNICPEGDCILVQMRWSTDPLAPHYEYELLPKSTKTYESSVQGQDYVYLEVNQSIELDNGIGLLVGKHKLTYLGEGKVIIEPQGRRFIGKLGKQDPMEIVTIPRWNR